MTSKPAPQLQNSANDEDWIQALKEVEEITVDEADAEKDRHKSLDEREYRNSCRCYVCERPCTPGPLPCLARTANQP